MTEATPAASAKKMSTSSHREPGTHETRPFCPKWGEPRTRWKARSIRAPTGQSPHSYSAIRLFVFEQQPPALHRLPNHERRHAENHIRNSLDERQPERGFGRHTEHHACGDQGAVLHPEPARQRKRGSTARLAEAFYCHRGRVAHP